MSGYEFETLECSTDETQERVDHFRRIEMVLENLDDIKKVPRVPNHEESIEELRKINNFLCKDHQPHGVIDLTMENKKKLDDKKLVIDEVISIGDKLFSYCRQLETADLSVVQRQNHCEVLLSFLGMKESRIADEYRNAIDGVIENHEELVGLMSEINEQRYQIYTYMANSKGVEV